MVSLVFFDVIFFLMKVMTNVLFDAMVLNTGLRFSNFWSIFELRLIENL